jgi:AAA-like domain
MFSVFVAVGGKSPQQVGELVESIKTTFARQGIRFRDPQPGKQEELWAAMQPGAPRSPIVDAVADETTIGEFAELVPFTAACIGHTRGPMIGQNLTSGLSDMVRLAAEEVVQANRAASIAIVASVGGGKSSLGKHLMYLNHGRGHSWGALDRSNIQVAPGRFTGEWVPPALALPDTQVIDICDAPGSLDPLKVWAHHPAEASRRANGLLIDLLRMDESQELALSEALAPERLGDGGIASITDLAAYLTSRNHDAAAVMVGRKIAIWRNYPFARALFDETLPPLRLRAQGTVFRTHGLQLPTANKVLNEHLHRKLRHEERYAIAIYPLAAAFMRQTFAERQTPGWMFFDESWTITRNPVGGELLEVDIRDGRKHDIYPVFMTHAAQIDLADDIYKLISIKFVGRAEDEDLARDNLEWFGAMPITDEAVGDLMGFKDGRFYMTMVNDDDEHGRQVAEIQTLLPAEPRIRAAMNTTPLRGRARRAGLKTPA